MPKQYKILRAFEGGLNSRQDPRDIQENQLSNALGGSVDKIGKLKTVGGLTAHTEVPTQGAVVVPGSGLKVYSSDHWIEGTPTIEDVLAADNAASDEAGEVNSTGSWAAILAGSISSVADTDGGAIASNGTTWIIKHSVLTAGITRQVFTTTPGQQYIVSADNHVGTADRINVGINDVATTLTLGASFSQTAAAWQTHEIRFVAIGTSTQININTFGGTDAAYTDKVFIAEQADSSVLGDWLALTDASEAQVDLYSDNADSFTDGLIDFGTVSTYVATADSINFPTTFTISDSTGSFLNKGMQVGQTWKLSNTDGAVNDVMIIIQKVTNALITVRGAPLTVDVDNDSAVTFTKHNPTSFHYVNDSLRASPVGGGGSLRPKHYSFIDRIHFGETLFGGTVYNNWFLNDIGPIAPTELEIEVPSNGSRDIDITIGAGFELGLTLSGDTTGEWIAETYQIASSFIYGDDESALFVPSSDNTVAIAEGDKLTCTVRAAAPYDESISGGRIYARINGSDDAWVLLADIDMKRGARATLSGEYNSWNDATTGGNELYTDNFDSVRQNADTYEGLTGLFPDTIREGFTDDNRFWTSSVIAGNRCFLFSPRYTAQGGVTSRFADRIIYSEPGAYDIFPIANFIDVVRGDADDYVTGSFWNGKLLCFKQRNLFVVDITSPDPADWRLEKTFMFRGAKRAAAVFPTPHGIAWCNEWGVWIYDGNDVIDLLGNKIDFDDWNAFWTDYSITGYYPKADLLILMRDCTGQGGSTVDETMIFNFRLQAWTTADDLFDTSKPYTNFETDWNQDLIIGEEASGTVTIKKFTDSPTAQTANNIDWQTKDIDFGNPSVFKNVDVTSLTYKSSAAQTDPVSFAINGVDSWTAITGNMVNTSDAWAQLVLEPTPIQCYSIRLRVRNTTNTGTIELNDVSMQFREIKLKVS